MFASLSYQWSRVVIEYLLQFLQKRVRLGFSCSHIKYLDAVDSYNPNKTARERLIRHTSILMDKTELILSEIAYIATTALFVESIC